MTQPTTKKRHLATVNHQCDECGQVDVVCKVLTDGHGNQRPVCDRCLSEPVVSAQHPRGAA